MLHPPPSRARYDRRSGAIIFEFYNGSTFMVPARSLEGLADASEREIAGVELIGESVHWESLNVDHKIALLMNGIFGSPVFTSRLARTTSEGLSGLEEPPSDEWVGPVIEFLSANLPGDRELGWEHHFVTAYQIGCEALVALGQADETTHGAVPRDNPALPAILPRWDDVATAVIYLAAQNGLITFLGCDDAGPAQRVGARNQAPHQPGNEMWAARADPQVTSVLRSLGLLDGYEWTTASETVMWRDSPVEWQIDFTSDPRFIDAVNDACEYMPDNIREKIDRLTRITEDDIAAHSSGVNQKDGGVPKQSVARMPPKTPDEVRATIYWIRSHDFDELFYQFWRIGEGWLPAGEAKRTLEIFNDPLAIAMRRAVATRLYPDLPRLAE
ncbi:DUF2442 domain-containing protein [Rhizobium leguminosarum bv. viciae]|nr:DUF2442 domain-containing protein [Rhizobium leguminosarum bv. viciae]